MLPSQIERRSYFDGKSLEWNYTAKKTIKRIRPCEPLIRFLSILIYIRIGGSNIVVSVKEETRLLMSIIDHKTPFNSVLQLKSHEEQNADVCVCVFLCFMCTRDVKQIYTLETKKEKRE